MKCPFCENEMLKGMINVPDEHFQFIPEGIKIPKLRLKWTRIKGAVMIKHFSTFEKGSMWMYKCPAYFCKHCDKVMIDIVKQYNT